MCPGFKSRRRCHMWVEVVFGSLLCSERFFSGYSGFPLSSKTNISKFQFNQESGRRRTTMWMCYLQIVIYLFCIGRPRKAGPPPERKLEGSIDVIGGEGSRGMWIVVLWNFIWWQIQYFMVECHIHDKPTRPCGNVLFDCLPIDTLFIALTDEFLRSPQHNLYVIERHHEDLDTRRHFSPFSCWTWIRFPNKSRKIREHSTTWARRNSHFEFPLRARSNSLSNLKRCLGSWSDWNNAR